MGRNMININSDQFVVLANKLEKIGRAELPVAVRSTLNEMAFRMKGTGGARGQIDKRAEKDFDFIRNKKLFKKLTGATKAKGLDIGNMRSEAGIINQSGLNEVAEGLADQQRGGKTKQKATPLSPSRIGKSRGKKIRSKSRLESQGEAYKINRRRGKRFIQLALRAERTGRPILITGKGGDKFLANIKGFIRRRNKIDFKFQWLYRINRDKTIDLKKKRPFVSRAAQEVMKGMPQEFVKQANKRIQKAMK